MKVLIINTTIPEQSSGRALTGIDSAITFELYKKYRSLGLTANHMWNKYTFIDEKDKYIGTFRSMDELIKKKSFLGNCLTLTHEQWLDEQNPVWRSEERYWYW
jgi:hypothetical protein